MTEPKHIIIVGAGVIGLQTAISLLTSPSTSNFKITIIAAHIPGDSSPDTTYGSIFAGAYWHSQATLSPEDAEIRDWDKRTYEFWTQLLNRDEGDKEESYEERVKRIGLGFKEHQYYWLKESPETEGHDGRGLWWRNVVSGFEVLDLSNKDDKGVRAPPGDVAVFGVRYQTVCINTTRYLEYLLETVEKLGATVIKAELQVMDGVEGVIRYAKSISAEKLHVKEKDVFALINCTGLEARKFVEEEEREKIRPILGQMLLLRGEAKMAGTCVGFPEEWGIEYVIPRPGTGTTILGGSRFDFKIHHWNQNVAGNWNATMTQRLRIWDFAREIRTEQWGADGFECLRFDIVSNPKREGGPRVEVQGREQIEGVWVVHAYGHYESSFQNSVGCAEKIVRLISRL